MKRILLVRHALPVVTPESDRTQWPLTDEGRAAAAALVVPDRDWVWWSSDERKAIETAEAMGHTPMTSPAFREITCPWVGDNKNELTCRYLSGEPLPDWEPAADAVARFTAGVAAIDGDDIAIVTHGMVATLYTASVQADLDAPAFWSALQFPDAWTVEA